MFDIVIPVYKPDKKFDQLMNKIKQQTVKPNHIFIMNTVVEGKQPEEYECLEGLKNVTIVPIRQSDFDHGGTRGMGASMSEADFLLFLTQDAVPADQYMAENLLKEMQDEKVAVAYGRQLAGHHAGVIEKYTRKFNYPDQSSKKSKDDIKKLGIKTYFCSNVCAMYRRSVYHELGGFIKKTIFNEDMIFASKIINAGYVIVYASDARVIHSHKYTYWQQFTRNFDLGVSQTQNHDIFGQVSSESEGMKLVKQTVGFLLKSGRFYLVPDLVLQSGFKLLGYKFGQHYKRLPKKVILLCSMNKAYWK